MAVRIMARPIRKAEEARIVARQVGFHIVEIEKVCPEQFPELWVCHATRSLPDSKNRFDTRIREAFPQDTTSDLLDGPA